MAREVYFQTTASHYVPRSIEGAPHRLNDVARHIGADKLHDFCCHMWNGCHDVLAHCLYYRGLKELEQGLGAIIL